MATPDAGFVWRLIVILGIGSFAMRVSFIQLYAWLDDLPPAVERALGFIPAAVLAAIIAPAVFTLSGPLVEGLVNPHSVSAAAAAVVAWRTRNMTATILVGMLVLWGIRFGVA